MNKLIANTRSGFPAEPELANLRGLIDQGAQRFPRHPQASLHYKDLAGVRCLTVTPPTIKSNLLYFHGGGFRLGSPEISAGFVSQIAMMSECRVTLPFYSLAPESPFPNALLEGQAVLESFSTELPLFIGGDSAGGNLAAVLSRRFAAPLSGAILLSPWLDLRVNAASYNSNATKDKVFSRQAASQAAALYLQDHSAEDSDTSPLLANLKDIPQTLVIVGSPEVLLDDAKAYTEASLKAGSRVDLHIISDMQHVEATLNPNSKHCGTVLQLVSTFLS